MTDLEARVAALEDELALRQLLARFAFLEDTGRDAEWVALWTEDGVYDLDGTQVVGHAALRALMPEYRHWMHTHSATLEVRVEGDTAVALGYTVLHQERDGAIAPISAASNRWTFRRVEGRWLVAGRVRRQIGTDGFDDALG